MYQKEKKSRTSFSEVWELMPLTLTVFDMMYMLCGVVKGCGIESAVIIIVGDLWLFMRSKRARWQVRSPYVTFRYAIVAQGLTYHTYLPCTSICGM